MLSANTTLGLFRGLTTFGQLWYDWDGTTYTLEAPINIVDSPAYVSAFRIMAYPAIEPSSLSAIPWIHARHGAKLVSLGSTQVFI